MHIFYLAKRSSCEISKAFFFLLFISTWVFISILPIHIENSNETSKTITTILLSTVPLPLTSFYLLVAFVYVAFNKDPTDDHKINLIALLLIIVAWIVSWSGIYLIYWTWYDNHAFPILPVISEPFEAFGYMLGVSAGIYASDQPPIADAHMVSLADIIGIHSILSTFLNICLLGIIGGMVRERVSQKSDSLSIPYPKYSSSSYYPQTLTAGSSPYEMSVSY